MKRDPLANLRQPTMDTHPPVQPSRTPAVHVVLSDDEFRDQLLKLALSQQQYLKRLTEMAYNYKNPVDESAIIGTNAAAIPQPGVAIQADYDQTEMYEAILFSLPLGTTAASLNIGSNRVIPLYNGAAIAVQQPVLLMNLRILAVADDRRTLTIAGALTTNGYIGLMGHCFEREGAR